MLTVIYLVITLICFVNGLIVSIDVIPDTVG